VDIEGSVWSHFIGFVTFYRVPLRVCRGVLTFVYVSFTHLMSAYGSHLHMHRWVSFANIQSSVTYLQCSFLHVYRGSFTYVYISFTHLIIAQIDTIRANWHFKNFRSEVAARNSHELAPKNSREQATSARKLILTKLQLLLAN